MLHQHAPATQHVHYEIYLKLLTIGYLTSNFTIVALADDDGGPNLAFKQIIFNNIHNIIALIVTENISNQASLIGTENISSQASLK